MKDAESQMNVMTNTLIKIALYLRKYMRVGNYSVSGYATTISPLVEASEELAKSYMLVVA